jgi:hypothetical protein
MWPVQRGKKGVVGRGEGGGGAFERFSRTHTKPKEGKEKGRRKELFYFSDLKNLDNNNSGREHTNKNKQKEVNQGVQGKEASRNQAHTRLLTQAHSSSHRGKKRYQEAIPSPHNV